MALLRTVTFGMAPQSYDAARTAQRVRAFFGALQEQLADTGWQTRCQRYVSTPLGTQGSQWSVPDFVHFGVSLEQELGDDIWCCLPGPGYQVVDYAGFDAVQEMLKQTQHVFSNVKVGGPAGLNNLAVNAAADIMLGLAQRKDSQQANFRFAAMANTAAGIPFFPAAYHEDEPAFSIALELAEDFNRCCAEHGDMSARLQACRAVLRERVGSVLPLAQAFAEQHGVRFAGFDLSLAPFPGEGSSAVSVIERLSGCSIGQVDFLFSLFAVNDMLKHATPGIPRVGFNGTMLSVLEDNRLAEAVRNKEVSITDLLLYSTVCGCGLDMIPVAHDVQSGQLASLIRAIATIAQKWNKPLIARILPSHVDAHGQTDYAHDFLVNTSVMPLDDVGASAADPVPYFTSEACTA